MCSLRYVLEFPAIVFPKGWAKSFRPFAYLRTMLLIRWLLLVKSSMSILSGLLTSHRLTPSLLKILHNSILGGVEGSVVFHDLLDPIVFNIFQVAI